MKMIRIDFSEFLDKYIFCFLNAHDKSTSRIYDDLSNIYKDQPFLPILFLGSDSLNEYLFDLRCLFLDSSIWFKFVRLESMNFNKSLLKNELIWNHEIHSLNVAEEFRHFQIRVVEISKLKIIGGHASKISPMVFHSESKMKDLLEVEVKRINEMELCWRVLLVDDFAITKMNASNPNHAKTKMQILETLVGPDKLIIDSVYEKSNENVGLIKKCITKLVNCKYDIIFLDYLLGYKDNKTTIREYSHELILILNYLLNPSFILGKTNYNDYYSDSEYNDLRSQILKNIGPFGRFWIFPISSFSSSMFDRLREKGITLISDKFYISRGADSVNTPELFKYELHKYMNLMIDEATFNKNTISDFFTYHKIDIENIRMWAQSHIGIYMQQFGRVAQLEDEENGLDNYRSIFAKTFLKFYKERHWVDFQIAEHLRDLLYNLAYGTVRERDTLLENLSFLESTQDFISIIQDCEYRKGLKAIKNYVVDLPS